MTDDTFRLSPSRQTQPYYTAPADKGPVCMHAGELVRSPTFGTVAVRPKLVAPPADALFPRLTGDF